MSRHAFGGSVADWLLMIDGGTGDAEPVAGVVVQFYTALTGGSQITDLLDGTGTPVTTMTTDSNGFLTPFSGPATSPDTRMMAADANSGLGPRRWVYATDVTTELDSIEANVAAQGASIASLATTVGSIVAGGGGIALAGLTDVSLASPQSGQFLEYNGTKWTNKVLPRATIAVVYSSDCPVSLVGAVDNVYTFQCDGVADEVEINAAITAVAATGQTYSGTGISGGTGTPPSAGGGIVILVGYNWYIANPVTGKSWVEVRSAFGRAAARIHAANGFTGTQLIQLEHLWTERFEMGGFTVDGNKSNSVTARGLYVKGQTDLVAYTYKDPGHIFKELIFSNSGGDGVYVDAAAGASRFMSIRVESAAANGWNVHGSDSFFGECDEIGSGQNGWNLFSNNCVYRGCRSALAGQDAWFVSGARDSLSGCEAKDTVRHGFNVQTGKNAISGCLADSNGTAPTGHGAYIVATSYVSITGLVSGDRNGSPHQGYGVYLTALLTKSLVSAVTFGNATGSLYDNGGAYSADPTTLITVKGD